LVKKEKCICERWTEGDVTVGCNESVIAMWSITIDGDRTLLTTDEFVRLYRCMREALDDC
jgi:hypothetical protein